MEKRSFLKALGLTLLGSTGLTQLDDSGLFARTKSNLGNKKSFRKDNLPKIKGTYSKGKETTVVVNGSIQSCSIMHITDTHITVPSEDDKKIWGLCKRMHQAYKDTKKHVSGENISRTESFRMLIDIAKHRKVDLLVMSGDIVNFPSPSTVDFVYNTLQESGVPYVYISGNHDWHLEGTPGSDDENRLKFIPVLKPLYQGHNPLYYSVILKGINIVCIDNSTYQVSREQLDFLKEQIKREYPIVLVMHIPLCTFQNKWATMGNEKWGPDIDTFYKIERREIWSSDGNRPETVEFCQILKNTPDIIVLCGHVHSERVEHEDELTQYVTGLSRDGAYRILNFVGAEKKQGKES